MRHRLLAARVLVSVGMAWLVTLPALLRLGVQHPTAAVAVAVSGASFALWGLALGALFRKGRPFELVLVAAAYVSVQGALVLNALTDPMATLTAGSRQAVAAHGCPSVRRHGSRHHACSRPRAAGV